MFGQFKEAKDVLILCPSTIYSFALIQQLKTWIKAEQEKGRNFNE